MEDIPKFEVRGLPATASRQAGAEKECGLRNRKKIIKDERMTGRWLGWVALIEEAEGVEAVLERFSNNQINL